MNKKKEVLAAVVVTVLLVLYFALYFGIIIKQVNGIWKYLLSILPLMLSFAVIYTCIDRIREINKGENDAARKY